MSSLISPQEFSTVTHKMRSFFNEKGFVEVHTQNRLSILAACEDPTTVATYNYNDIINNKTDPRIIAYYSKDSNGQYFVPQFFNK